MLFLRFYTASFSKYGPSESNSSNASIVAFLTALVINSFVFLALASFEYGPVKIPLQTWMFRCDSQYAFPPFLPLGYKIFFLWEASHTSLKRKSIAFPKTRRHNSHADF